MNKTTTKGFTQRYGRWQATAILIAVLFCAIGLLSACVGPDNTQTETLYNEVGDGTEQSPYLIGNAKQLRDLAATANAGNPLEGVYIKMTADIDLSDYGADFNAGEGWDPIGNGYGGYFDGNFDGGGYEVQNLYINAKTSHEGAIGAGLFGIIFGSIKNLGVKGEVSVTADAEHIIYAAGVVGMAGETERGGIITNCYNMATISVSVSSISSAGISAYGSSSSSVLAGGIAGGCSDYIITNCYNAGSISVSNSGYGAGMAGGITTLTGDNSIVEGCYNTGSVSASGLGSSTILVAGILVGGKSRVANCYNAGSISAAGTEINGSGGVQASGIAVRVDGVSNCYNRGSVSATSDTGEAYAGAIVVYGTGESSSLDVITDCFYDKDVFAGGAVGEDPELFPDASLTTAQMTAQNALEVGAMSVLQGVFARRFGADGTYYPELKVFLDYENPINQDIIREASEASAAAIVPVYTIGYENVNGATNDNNPATYTYKETVLLADLGARRGFSFGGWYDNADFTGSAIKSIAAGSFGDKTFYAKWTETGGNSWIIWLLVAVIAIAGGAALMLIIIKKRKGQLAGAGAGAQRQQPNAAENAYVQQPAKQQPSANPYAPQQPSVPANPYAQPQPPQQNPYGQSNPYAQNPYGQSNPYAQNPYTRQPSQPNPYAPQNPYSQPQQPQNPYGQSNPYAPQQPQQGQNPYGQQYSNPYKPYNPYDPYDKNR